MSLKAPKQIAILIALVLAGMQGFALFHGAEFKFAPHVHGAKSDVSFSVNGQKHSHDHRHGGDGHPGSTQNCDLLLYLDGQSRPADVPGVVYPIHFAVLRPTPPQSDVFVERFLSSISPRAPPASSLA